MPLEGRPPVHAPPFVALGDGLDRTADEVAVARICHQLPEELRDKESWRVLFARRAGADVGFAMFRRTHKWERARPAGELSVWALVGDPAAQLALLRRLVDFDLIGTVKIGIVGRRRPAAAVGGRAEGDVRRGDLRQPVGPPGRPPRGAAGLTWSAPCDVVIEVADTMAPWNDGNWRIRADAPARPPWRGRQESPTYGCGWTRWEPRTSAAATSPRCSAPGA